MGDALWPKQRSMDALSPPFLLLPNSSNTLLALAFASDAESGAGLSFTAKQEENREPGMECSLEAPPFRSRGAT